MMAIHWPQVIVVTTVLYALVLINLLFNPIASTVFLFAIISYWSRLPGVGIPSPFFILYFLDLVDILSLIIAINIGPWQGALFSVFGNFGSRMAGVFPKWWSVIRDGSFQFIICLFIPYVHQWTGSNIAISMMVYTMVRRFLFIPVYLIYQDIPIPDFIILWIGATSSQALINYFYAKYFGSFFNNLLQSGVNFNWPIFIFVTIAIITGKIYFFGTSKVKYLDQRFLLRKVFNKLDPKQKKQIHASITDESLVEQLKESL